MANVKISDLPALTPPEAADLVPVTDSSASQTKRTTVGEIVGIINGEVDVANDGTATIIEFPVSRLQDGNARQLLQTDAAGTGVEWTSDVDIPGTLDVTSTATLDAALNVAGLASLDGGIDVDGAFTVANTSGNIATSGTLDVYSEATLASAIVEDLTNNRVLIAGTGGAVEDDANLTFDGTTFDVGSGNLQITAANGNTSIAGTLGVSGQSTLASAAVSDLTSGRVVLAGTSGELEDSAGLTFNGTQLDVDGNVVITGDLTVEGVSTILETETLTVEDKNIELGVVDTPTDATANGGGITLKGATDKTINWVNATDAWTSSEHIALASGKEFYINGNGVLNATTLGSGVVTSSLTSVGTIGTGVWQGTAIDDTYLATISTAGKVSNSATTATSANTASAIVARDGSGNFAAGTITAALTGNADTATALSSSRTFAVTGDVTGTVSSDLTSGASIATSIASGVIVNEDVNASAAIAGTKIDPNFGSQTIETTGVINAGSGTAAAPSVSVGTSDNGIYSPGADTVAISTAGTARALIDSNGNVGIGVSSITNIANRSQLVVGGTNGGLIDLSHGATAAEGRIYVNDGELGLLAAESDGEIKFQTGGSNERCRIDSSGRLLAGTSSARTDLIAGTRGGRVQIEEASSSVATALDNSSLCLTMGHSGPTGSANVFFTRTKSDSLGGVTRVVNNDTLGGLYFQGTDGTDAVPAALIKAEVDGATGANDMPGRLVFSTTSDAASSPTSRVQINSGGTLMPSADNSYNLGRPANRWAAVYAANGTIQTSDERHKTEIQTSTLGTDFIKSLRPVSYKWIVGHNTVSKDVDGETDLITPRAGVRRHWGFIAQEVKQSVDDAGVDFGGWLLEDKDDPDSQQALRYDQFIAPLTKALQEAIAKIETLERRLSDAGIA